MRVSIKLCYRPSAIKGKDGTLYYQIIIKRTTHTYASGYRIYPNEWDKQYGRLFTNSSSLIKIKNRTDWEMQQIYAIAKRHIDKGTPLDFGCIIYEFEEFNRQQSFSGFLLSQAERLADMGRTRTSETYISALHSFIKFNNDEDIMLYEITAEVMEDYERYLKNRNLTMNSISFYMRTLRTVLNKAVKLHLVEAVAPFQSVYTGIAQTVKRAIDEILWIWQKKSNNVNDLNSHIWDQWADEDGSIGKAYGYQMAKKYKFKTKEGIKEMDQVDYCLYLLNNDPASRRIMTNIFNHEELKDMNLEPCAYGTQWLVKEGKLHLILNQRSQDMLAANGWNTMQYAALLCMFAQVAGLEVGTLTHNIGDCHIYDRHIPLIEKLIEAESMDVCPKLVIKNPTKNFYDFKVEDFEIEGYDYNKDIKLGKIPVAI